MTATVRIPDRYEAVVRMATGQDLRSLVEEVREGLSVIEELYDEMESAGRGAFLIVEGRTGSGKTTFLNTVFLFRRGVTTVAIEPRESIPAALDTLGPVSETPGVRRTDPLRLRIVTIKDRESLSRMPMEEVARSLHAINQFLRTPSGLRTLIAWPCTGAELRDTLVSLAREIGGTALLSSRDGAFLFHGPPRSQYLSIAKRTIATFNAGATLTDLGITEEEAARLAEEADTIGAFLLRLNQEARRNQGMVKSRLPAQEQYRIFIVVVSGNGAEGDTDALTRGAYFTADIDRLLASTDANLVKGLRAQPEKLGVLATMFDAKLIHVPPAVAMAVVRDFADDALRARLSAVGFPNGTDKTGAVRLAESRLVRALRGEPVGLQKTGRKLGDKSLDEFRMLTELAAKDDAALNRTFGRALLGAGLIHRFEDEKHLDLKEKRSGDLLCQTDAGPVLLEFMWRRRTTRGAIAQYVLTKLVQYGRNIGFLGEG